MQRASRYWISCHCVHVCLWMADPAACLKEICQKATLFAYISRMKPLSSNGQSHGNPSKWVKVFAWLIEVSVHCISKWDWASFSRVQWSIFESLLYMYSLRRILGNQTCQGSAPTPTPTPKKEHPAFKTTATVRSLTVILKRKIGNYVKWLCDYDKADYHVYPYISPNLTALENEPGSAKINGLIGRSRLCLFD